MGVHLGEDYARLQAHRARSAALARATRGERRAPWWVRMLERIWGVAA
jgi:hypothetical protein